MEHPEGFGVPHLVRFSTCAVEALGAARQEIDALNVYPVPDGDTGTNLFLTFESAHTALLAAVQDQGGEARAEVSTTAAAYSRGLLLGARGNSGVIMAQLMRALLDRLTSAGADEVPTEVASDGLAVAADAGYAAVGRPVEGTILTVARAAAEEAHRLAADPTTSLAALLEGAATAAREALDKTPTQLQVLQDAGVVDAGGLGLCVVLEAAARAYAGRRPDPGRPPSSTTSAPTTMPTAHLSGDGPAAEVMYLLDAPDDTIPALRTTLDSLGDSLVVVGGDGLWNVHVHVDDVGAAIEAGIAAGRPHRIRVTHLTDQPAPSGTGTREGHPPETRAVVVVAFGPGLAKVYGEAGATVVEATLDRRPSTGELLEAIRSSGAPEVVLLTNDRNVVPAAQAAADVARAEDQVQVVVIPTVAQVQGLAALAVHDPTRPLSDDARDMTAAARHARSGAVTVATRRAITTGGQCEPGDVLGAVEGDFAVVGDDLLTVATTVMDRLLGGGGELCTLVTGADAGQLADRCTHHLATHHPSVEVVVYDGGQDRYPLLIGVE